MRPSGRRQLPLEVVEEIVTEAWKATSTIYERQDLYLSLQAAHTTFGDIIERVMTRFVILASLSRVGLSDAALYVDMIRRIEHPCIVSLRYPTASEQTMDVARRFHASHVRFDADQMTFNNTFHQFLQPGGMLRPILAAVTSITLSSVPSSIPGGTGVPTEEALGVLQDLPNLTHLHLDFDEASFPGRHRRHVLPIVLPTVAFLRTRTCPGCGLASCAYGGARDQIHAPECLQGAFARAFPALRELQLDAPLFLRYMDPPRTLERVTLGAPPAAGKMLPCTIEWYNVAPGLRRWLEPREEDGGVARHAGRGMRLREVVVRTGTEMPLGWGQAEEACERFGVQLVREYYYYN